MVGAIDELRPRVTKEIAQETIENRIQHAALSDQVANVEARYRRLLSGGADSTALEATAGNLRLENKRLIAVEQRASELADIAQSDRYAGRFGNALGTMIGVSRLVEGDREVSRLAKSNPREAWRSALGTAMGVFVDGVLAFTRWTGGGLKGGVLDVGLGSAAERTGRRIADATFNPVNRLAHALAEKSWWPKNRRPREPIDRDPSK